MEKLTELLKRYTHVPEEYPVLSRQTHKVLKDGKIASETIDINENLIHYVQDTALLISVIDGTIAASGAGPGEPFNHVVYLDKSARPVSWLVGLFWKQFAAMDGSGQARKRPPHSYINIDRAPWFRKVGIEVSDDGRRRTGGELATYADFLRHISEITSRQLAEIRALYIPGGIETEDVDRIIESPTSLDGDRVLIVDEVYRTGATLDIAVKLFQMAFPKAQEVAGAYFWHPKEPPLRVGNENVLTSLPVWYDPDTLDGRGIGGINEAYYRSRYQYYLELFPEHPEIDIRKLRTQAFSAAVYSAPLLTDNGNVLDLKKEMKSRALCRDFITLSRDYKAGSILFAPPHPWIACGRFETAVLNQGMKLIPEDSSPEESEKIRQDRFYYPNFLRLLTGKDCDGSGVD